MNIFITIFFFIVTTVKGISFKEQCLDDGYFYYEHKCYSHHTTIKTWDAAMDDCNSRGGYLAHMLTMGLIEALYNHLWGSGYMVMSWIGAKEFNPPSTTRHCYETAYWFKTKSEYIHNVTAAHFQPYQGRYTRDTNPNTPCYGLYYVKEHFDDTCTTAHGYFCQYDGPSPTKHYTQVGYNNRLNMTGYNSYVDTTALEEYDFSFDASHVKMRCGWKCDETFGCVSFNYHQNGQCQLMSFKASEVSVTRLEDEDGWNYMEISDM